jgi:O-acetyl-ADP-ribose deacetylase (regulator of RNase III)
LQTQPFKDIYLLRQAENEKLSSYGWVDQGAGVVRVPVEEAIRIMSEREAIKSVGGSPAGLDEIVQDSSAGRTAAPRY